MWITGCFLIGLSPYPWEKIHAWYYNLGQKPMAGEGISPNVEDTTFVPPNVPVKLPSKCMCSIPVEECCHLLWSEKLLFQWEAANTHT